MNIRFVCRCRPRYLIGSGSNRRCLIMTLMKSRWRAVGFPSAPWYEIFSFVSRLKWTVEFVEVWRWTSHSAAQSEGAVWLLHRTPPWLSDCCQNVNVYTARPSFRLHRRRDSIIQVSQLCLDVFFFASMSMQRKTATIVTRGFCACRSLCVRVRVNRWDYPWGLIVSHSSLPIKKRWNLHRPVFENSSQPQAGGLWQNHPTAAGNAPLAGSHHLCQRRRHTVRGAAQFWLHPRCSGAADDLPCLGL